MDYLYGAAIILGYLIVAILLARLVHYLTSDLSFSLRLISRSFLYAFIFGIGLLSYGPGEPGFGIPMPILPAAFFAYWDSIPIESFIDGIVTPFLFWWGLILLLMLIVRYYQRLVRS